MGREILHHIIGWRLCHFIFGWDYICFTGGSINKVRRVYVDKHEQYWLVNRMVGATNFYNLNEMPSHFYILLTYWRP